MTGSENVSSDEGSRDEENSGEQSNQGSEKRCRRHALFVGVVKFAFVPWGNDNYA